MMPLDDSLRIPRDVSPRRMSSLSISQSASSARLQQSPSRASLRDNLVVFSGGSAANNLVDVFERVRESSKSALSYVIPISDNGGSTSEIIRVFGGPGIGDVRSRLVRLIPEDGSAETIAIKQFFNHRLPKSYTDAKAEWHEILEGAHPLWLDMSSPKRELIRSHLNSFHLEVVKRMRPSSRFDFSGASIGNLFLTGARLFTGSFEAAIYLLSVICNVHDKTSVLPALNTNFAVHIAAELTNGDIITGQNDISHPSAPTRAVPGSSAGMHTPATIATPAPESETDKHDAIEDANLPGSLPALRRPQIIFSKDQEEDLPARIDRIWYINPYGQEIRMPANPRVLEALGKSSAVIYSIGSLYTSLIPNLILKGVGEHIASPAVQSKVLLLNGSIDRESGPSTDPLTALDFVRAICTACANSRGLPPPREEEYGTYVTHVIHLEGQGAPAVDKAHFARLGIDTLRLYGPKDALGRGGRYDANALGQALETIIGRKDARMDKSRRNTLVG